MSNNPFETPPPQKPVANPYTPGGVAGPPAKKSLPGGMMAIAIICLILGLGGLSGSCFGGVALGFQGALMDFIENAPIPEADKEFNRMNMAAQQGAMIPAIVLMVVNLFVAGLLVFGSIGGLRRKESG